MENDQQNLTTTEPSLYGCYAVRTAYQDNLLTLTVLHVDRKWMPFDLFGRAVLTKIVSLQPDGACDAVSIHHTRYGLLCESSDAENMLLGPEWPSSLRDDAHRQIIDALHNKRTGWSLRKIILSVLAVILIFFILSRIGANSLARSAHNAQLNHAQVDQAAPGLSEAEQAQMSSALAAQRAVAENGANLAMKDALAKAQKIVMHPMHAGGKGIIVWSDPLCSNCRDFEQGVMEKLPADIGVTIIPVAFKDGSRPLVSYIVCGKDGTEQMARWSGLMSPQPTGKIDMQCPEGPGLADSNSVLFARSGLSQTPTIMSSSGERIFEGDHNSMAEIEAWVRK